MSEFDKEAERERLREKYEADQEDRETTERMSELLLQGATMTNRHCDRCGDPIFRYQGQEFCPSCQAEAQDAQAQAQQADATQAEAASGTGGGADGAAPDAGATVGETGQPAATQPPTPAASTEGATGASDGESAALPEADAADLGEAGEALASTISTLAARAAQTDDPRRAKAFLEAAREAADALAALKS